VEVQWLMLQQQAPDDYVIASGEQHSVREFMEAAALAIDMRIEWVGRGVDERGVWNGNTIITIDPGYFRPTEVESLLGDASKARQKLGWRPRIGFNELVKEMAEADLHIAERERLMKDRGY